MRRLLTIALLLTCCIPNAAHSQHVVQSLTGSWSTASSKGFTARSSLAAVAIGTKIYAMGGYVGSTYLNTLEVYDAATETWSTPLTTGTFSPRRGLTAQVVDGKIYAIGGFNGTSALNTLEVFDPLRNSWSTPSTTGTFTAREKLCSAVVDGKIYVMGGFNESVHLNTQEVFDPATNTWTTPITTGTFTARRGLTASVVAGKIYVMGGYDGVTPYLNTLEVFDPATNAWSTPITTGTFTARGALTSAVLAGPSGGRIYTFGGVDYIAGVYHDLNTVEIFDPVATSWSTAASTGTFTKRHEIASALVNGKVYVLGGTDGGFLNVNEVFSAGDDAVDRLTAESALSIYPNPTSGSLSIASIPHSPCELSVMNLLGEEVMHAHVSSPEAIEIDLSTQPAALYLVRLTSSEGTIMRKLVKR